jgi:hypothetical protein
MVWGKITLGEGSRAQEKEAVCVREKRNGDNGEEWLRV